MENRRQTYRQAFEAQEVLRAELYRPGQRAVFMCDVLDISLGGLRARLRELVAPLAIDDSLLTRLIGRDSPPPIDLSLSLPSRIVSLEQRGEEWHCGLRFLPLADPRAAEGIERLLSRFILSEQRRRKNAPAS